jgi:hypothetical protein
MNEDPGKRFADKTARAARETFEKGSAAAEESARGMERSYSSAAEGIGPDADRHAKVLITRRRRISEQQIVSRNYFLPCSSRWAFTASSACPLP